MLVAVLFVILASSAVGAVTGFGFNLLSAPLLTFLLPPQIVVVLTLLLGLVTSGILFTRSEIQRGIDWRLVGPLVLSSLAGMPFGLALLLFGEGRVLRVMIAALTALFAFLMLVGVRLRLPRGPHSQILVGLLSGLLSTSTSLNGPPVALYLIGQDFPKRRFRANMIAFIFLATLGSLVLILIGGGITAPTLRMTLVLLPGVLVGLAGGVLVANAVSQKNFEDIVLGFLILVGLIGVAGAWR